MEAGPGTEADRLVQLQHVRADRPAAGRRYAEPWRARLLSPFHFFSHSHKLFTVTKSHAPNNPMTALP